MESKYMTGDERYALLVNGREKCKPDVTLASGRVVAHYRADNGSTDAILTDGGAMTSEEWGDYRAQIFASVDATWATIAKVRDERKRELLATFARTGRFEIAIVGDKKAK